MTDTPQLHTHGELPTRDRRAIMTCLQILDEFRKVRLDMPASHIFSFLTVALEEGKGVQTYAAAAGYPRQR